MSGFTFGAPNVQQQAGNRPQGTLGFGTAAAATTTGAPNFSFGTAAAPAATAAPAFGSIMPTASAAPAFGSIMPAASAAPAFGTLAPAVSTAQTFGNLAPAASAAAAFGSMMPTVSAAPAFGSIMPAASAASAFGGLAAAPATNTAVPTLGLGGAGAFSFGKPAAATTTSASLNFGTTTTSTAGFSTGLGLFGKTATSTAPATAPTPFVGLGGVDVSATQPKAGDSKQDHIKVKETQVPDEIAKTVDALKTYIKAQKMLSSDIGRTSTSKLTNVSGEIMNLQWALQEIANSVEANYNQIKLLRKETTKAIQSVEMAQRTQDTPAGLQFENIAPFQYFQNLVAKYEQDLINFRQQIAQTERHMRSLTNPSNITPEDLKRGFQQINESFISLAGRLHEIHQKVEAQKEQFLNLRKYRLRDGSNVFAKIDVPEAKVDTTRISAGPTPFSNISAMSSFGKSFANSAAAAAAAASGTTTAQTTK